MTCKIFYIIYGKLVKSSQNQSKLIKKTSLVSKFGYYFSSRIQEPRLFCQKEPNRWTEFFVSWKTEPEPFFYFFENPNREPNLFCKGSEARSYHIWEISIMKLTTMNAKLNINKEHIAV